MGIIHLYTPKMEGEKLARSSQSLGFYNAPDCCGLDILTGWALGHSRTLSRYWPLDAGSLSRNGYLKMVRNSLILWAKEVRTVKTSQRFLVIMNTEQYNLHEPVLTEFGFEEITSYRNPNSGATLRLLIGTPISAGRELKLDKDWEKPS